MPKRCRLLPRLCGLAILWVLAVPWTGSVLAADFTIGYLQLEKDPRYSKPRSYARYLGQSLGRPYQGAKVALGEVKFHGTAAGVRFVLKRRRVKHAQAMVRAAAELTEDGVRFLLVDAPADVLHRLSEHTEEQNIVLFNISARSDPLRTTQCAKHLLHVIPSHAMLADALVQYLVSRKWREALVLVGPTPADVALAGSFTRAAKRLGVKIVAQKPFELSNDPRRRKRNNIALLTAGEDYDVVFIADADGEFARNAAYRTVLPRPVIGADGLTAMAWHWAYERHGAPQLEKRFEKAAGRHMASVDWAAWLAVKAIASAVQRTSSADFQVLRRYLLSQELELDGFKGHRSNFRPWNGQLRQPLLLATHNWVIGKAPIEGFLHRTNNLDTLGFSQQEVSCAR
ncbi:MAG: ABC transporter substrate-binding protein [Gammaproteobacteria bacterium]|nr:ABC transporter substrate-binding protein [Gammaproteobacteria bacterium]